MNYLVVFFAIWWAWMNFTWFASAYDTDDVPYRLLTFVQIAGVLVLAAGVPPAFDDSDFAVDGRRLRDHAASRSSPSGCGPRARTRRAGRSRCGSRSASRSSRSAGSSASLVGWSEVGYLTFLVLGVARARGAGLGRARRPARRRGTRGHIVERYGLFTIIVLGECVLATTTAVAGGLRCRRRARRRC